jgi:vanillate O-demethylase ferredoxin subunit
MIIDVRVTRITYQAKGIVSIELRPVMQVELPSFSPGAHIELYLPNGLSRPYSLHSDTHETHRYEITVQREQGGRGGSRFLHDDVRAGDVVRISTPVNHFSLQDGAAGYILIGGGIGITPLIAMARHLQAEGREFALHYCGRGLERMALIAEAHVVAGPHRLHLHLDDGDPNRQLDVKQLLAVPRPGYQIYCCGPAGLLAAVRDATGHWPSGSVRYESFVSAAAAPVNSGGEVGFEVEIASTGEIIPVGLNESILTALRARGCDLDSSCEAGTCGVCRTRILEGVADHQDFVLAEDEQADWMMVCVSRAKTPRLKLEI